ncbi:hypothetical protein BDA96_03G103600 [Sorghum bicolor]|uniref:Uncharacterized protein n=1 Tax=Sorghum bicolor TaxID=4558 RepID=A0A921RAD1_SORBI|nr:hypothetical protein BDA96_03G103600 [Sorghum bicolor]
MEWKHRHTCRCGLARSKGRRRPAKSLDSAHLEATAENAVMCEEPAERRDRQIWHLHCTAHSPPARHGMDAQHADKRSSVSVASMQKPTSLVQYVLRQSRQQCGSSKYIAAPLLTMQDTIFWSWVSRGGQPRARALVLIARVIRPQLEILAHLLVPGEEYVKTC